jgi:hypothetical protein
MLSCNIVLVLVLVLVTAPDWQSQQSFQQQQWQLFICV